MAFDWIFEQWEAEAAERDAETEHDSDDSDE